MKKTKRFVAIVLSLGMMLVCSVTSFAAELPAQSHEASASAEILTIPPIWPISWANAICDVTGNGVAVRREPSIDADRLGLLYQGDWVRTSGAFKMDGTYIWMEITDSSIGVKSGWVAKQYLEKRQ